jgi:putative spermidine/putrescine transport system substrate-binding protein
MGRAENQAKLPKYIRYGVTNRDASKQIDPSLMGDLPTNPTNLNQAFPDNVKFWIDNIDKMTERWNKWAATN